jgi:tetratricopeptide (TPR) repeat protein
LSQKLKTPQDYLDFFTKDFDSDDNPKLLLIEGKNNLRMLQDHLLELPEKLQISHPYIVFIIFVSLKKYKFFGKWEKVAWEIPIKFKGVPFILTHRKFGFRIISNYKSKKVNLLAIEAISNIHKAIQFAEVLIEPEIRQQLQKGNVMLNNEYSNILNRYIFFRENAQNEYASIEETKKQASVNFNSGHEITIKSYNELLKKINAGDYFMIGMLDTYYSLLEHTLVLLLPFLKDKKQSSLNLENFIAENWKNKYKIVFDLSKEKEALKLLERLNKIKEDYRNPLTHGYFQKNGNSFYVHMKNLGAIPITLTKSNKTLKYHFGSQGHYTFKEICNCFDDFDKFLIENAKTKFGMNYIKSGLSISFDVVSCKMYRSQMTSMKRFSKFINYMSDEQDNATNMDW